MRCPLLLLLAVAACFGCQRKPAYNGPPLILLQAEVDVAEADLKKLIEARNSLDNFMADLETKISPSDEKRLDEFRKYRESSKATLAAELKKKEIAVHKARIALEKATADGAE